MEDKTVCFVASGFAGPSAGAQSTDKSKKVPSFSSSFFASKIGSSSFCATQNDAKFNQASPATKKAAQFVVEAAVSPRKVLVIGGTRFSGVYLVKRLQELGHDVTVFNRGKRAMPKLHNETEAQYQQRLRSLRTIIGDRTDPESIKSKLSRERFDVIYDNNGREMADTKPLADLFRDSVEHFVYMSSAGVYKMSDSSLPYKEVDSVDPKSRHKGKFETERYLREIGIPYTSIRPVYIYGPQNYNEVENWFFKRIFLGRPVPIPGHGQHITGMGHVEDLADAMAAVIGNPTAVGQIYNIQGDRSVTFDGLARACAEAMNKPVPEILHYNAKEYDFGKKKAFPFRGQHFFTSIEKAVTDLNWKPKYDLVPGLADSYENDFLPSVNPHAFDFETDDLVLKTLAVL